MAGWQYAKLPFYPKKMKQLNVSALPPRNLIIYPTLSKKCFHISHIFKKVSVTSSSVVSPITDQVIQTDLKYL